ncbi:MAG: hypothetical protein ABGW77_02550, partial [Campylobacterales bacterium]
MLKFKQPIYLLESSKGGYLILIGKFKSKLGALSLSLQLTHQFKKGFRAVELKPAQLEGLQLVGGIFIGSDRKKGKKNTPPRGKTLPQPAGHREVEIEGVIGSGKGHKFSLSDELEKGIYSIRLKLYNLYPVPLEGAKLYIKLNRLARVIAGSVHLGGKRVRYRQIGEYLVLNIGRFPGAKANPLEVELKFFA